MASNVSYSDRRTGPYPDEFRGRDEFGRSASLGRCESDRSERCAPLTTISDFLRHGRDRYARAGYGNMEKGHGDMEKSYGKSEADRPAARSQSIARLDNQRFGEGRYASQPRFDDCYERYPRNYQLEDRCASDFPEDRYTGVSYGRHNDDRRLHDSDKHMVARPGFERYMSDRPAYDRYPVDRMVHNRFSTDRPREDRMNVERFNDQCDDQFNRDSSQRKRFENERYSEHQRFGNERYAEQQRIFNERYVPERYSRQMTIEKYGDERPQKQERFSSEEKRYHSDDKKRTNERFAEERMAGGRVVKPGTDRYRTEY